MKYFFYSILTLSFLISCGNETNSTGSQEITDEIVSSEVSETAETENHFIVGDWKADAKDAGVEIKVSFSDEGTFNQDMAGQSQSGAWEVIDENQIKIDTENLKNGQIWKIVEKGDAAMKIVWSVKDGFSKNEIPFKKI